MTDRPAFSCTLGPDDLTRRETEDRVLAAKLIRHRWDGERQATLVFPADTDALLDRFVAEESACCSFFGFMIERDADEVRLRVTAPEGAEPMLEALESAFTARTD